MPRAMGDERIWTAGLLVIGDEILSGRTQDRNVAQVGAWLNLQGVRLAEVRMVPDTIPAIAGAVNALREAHDYLFTTGGIGPTHDDISVDGIAAALGREVVVHPQARAVLEGFYADRGGLNEARLQHFGVDVHCFVSDEDVIADARRDGTTRAVTAVRKAHARGLLHGGIYAIGNAPTALLEIVRLHAEEGVLPALVVGMPVGFVNASESKEDVMRTAIPYIVTRGRKGGSTITVAALHALLSVAGGDLR